MDILEILWKLAQALFDAFAKAIMDYPLVTALVLVATYAFLHQRRYLVLVDMDPIKIRAPEDAGEWTVALAGFIPVVIVSNVLGWTLDKVFGLLAKFLGLAGFLASPFDKNPIEFTFSFLVLTTIGFAWLWFRAGRRISRISVLQICAASIIVLFCTYISTSLITSATKSAEETSAAQTP